jgi:hypothetical protein
VLAFGLAGLGCSALLPLTISFGQEELADIAATLAGGVIAFYQLGYGIAAFCVGPLLDGGVELDSIYAVAAIIATAMGAWSFAVARRRASPTRPAEPGKRSGAVDRRPDRPEGADGRSPLLHRSVTSCSRWVRLASPTHRGVGRQPFVIGGLAGSQRRTGGVASALVLESSWGQVLAWAKKPGEWNGTSGVPELWGSNQAGTGRPHRAGCSLDSVHLHGMRHDGARAPLTAQLGERRLVRAIGSAAGRSIVTARLDHRRCEKCGYEFTVPSSLTAVRRSPLGDGAGEGTLAVPEML